MSAHEKLDKKYIEIILSDICKYLNIKKISKKEIFEKMYSEICSYVNSETLIKSFNEYLESNGLEKSKELVNINDISAINTDKIKDIISIYLENGQFYQITNLFSIIFKNIVDQNSILSSFHSKIISNDFYFENDPTKVYGLVDLYFTDGSKSIMKFSINRNCNFYIKKTYDKTDPNSVAKEIEYYNYDFPEKDEYLSKYPNLIIHSIKEDKEKDKNNEEKEENSNSNSIIIPYFPYQTLDSFIKNSEKYLFTIVDKIVMIKEAALSLYLLHYNGKSHRNITSSSFFVNEKKDIYIGGFSYSRSEDCKNTELSPQIYYRNFNTVNPTEIEEDIYSLGVLTYEIMTASSPMNVFGKMSRDERINILKSNYIDKLYDNYNELLLKNNKNIEEELKEIFENIITKCITNKKSDISVFKEIISDLDKLTLYVNFKEEIEYRIMNAISSSNYKCTFAQLVHNCYQGNLFCEKLINIFFEKQKYFLYQNEEIKNDLQTNIIAKILNLSNVENIQKVIQDDIQKYFKLRNINADNIVYDLDKMYKQLLDYVDNSTLIDSYQEYVNSEEMISRIEINISNKSYAEILEIIQNCINYCIKNGQFYQISNLFSIIFKNIVDQNSILSSFHSKIVSNDFYFENDPTKVYGLVDLNFTDGSKSIMKFSINRNCNFYIKKTYDKTDPNSVAKEIEYYNYDFPEKDEYLSKYPNLIIHSIKEEKDKDKNNEEKEENSNSNSIIIPYFPYQTLDLFIKNSEKYLFTIVDKIVMIKEAALSLYLLHYNGKSHRNITSSSFFVNEKKDIYIGGFSYSRSDEITNSKMSPPIYYRNFSTVNPTEIEEDIFSLGVLTYEIMTASSPVNIFTKMSRNERLNILKSNYIDKLYDNYNELLLKSNKNIEEELKEIFENIITKCITNKKSDISVFKEIISDLDKLTLYVNFKEEIEYRIMNAINSSNYKCTFAQLVHNFYQGNLCCEKLIESFFEKHKYFLDQEKKIINDQNKSIIERILSFFKNEWHSFELASFYDEVLHSKLLEIKNEIQIDNNNKLYNLSKKLIMTKNINLIPITTLDNFTCYLDKMDQKEKSYFIYCITKDLNYIHSNEMSHDELSKQSIGIFFNSFTKSFIPLLVPFYYFYKNQINSEFRVSKSKPIDKRQIKDVENCFSIIKEIDFPTYQKLYYSDHKYSMSNIVFNLYNINLQNQRIKSDCFFKYSDVSIRFSTFFDIFIKFKNNQINNIFNYFFNKNKELTLFNLKEALKYIITRLNIKLRIDQENKNEKIKTLLLEIDDLDLNIKIKIMKEREEEFD